MIAHVLHGPIEAPPILFIQGVGVAGSGWMPQVRELSREYRCLTFDNRGLGGSAHVPGPITIEAMAADALALMDAAGWEAAHVVGHSMGGVIAQQLALDAPGRVRSLSLLCTFARGRDAARMTPRVVWLGIRSRVGTRGMRRRAYLEMLYSPGHLASADLEALAAQTGELIGRDLADSPPILMKQLRALGAHDISARLKGLAGIPTLVLSAELDPIALPEYGRALAAAVPGARYIEVTGQSHGVVLEKPELVCGHIRSMIHGGAQEPDGQGVPQ